MRKEDHKKNEGKDAADKEIVTMAQINQKEWYKATVNANNKVDTQVHNAASPTEASKEPLVLSTFHQRHNPTRVDLCVNTVQELVKTKVREGEITLGVRCEDEVEVAIEVIEQPVEDVF